MSGAYPILTCYPPLEQLSVIPSTQNEIPFAVNIKWSVSRTQKYLFQVHLCMSGFGTRQHPSLWQSFPLFKSSQPTITFQDNEEWYSENFETTLSRQTLAKAESETSHQVFTIKYRIWEEAAWQWITCSTGFLNGEIILQQPLPVQPELGSLIELSPGWRVASVKTTNAAVSLFSIESEPIIGTEEKVLGLAPNQARYFAVSRIEPPWIAPRHGDGFLYLAERSILCSILRKDGNVVTVAAPSMDDVYTSLLSNEEGKFVVHARDDTGRGRPCRVMISVAHDIETSIATIMHNLQAGANQSRLVREMIDDEFKTDSTDSSHLSPLLDYLGFCTWNALGFDLTQDKILEALRVLKQHKIHISTLLVDDNWQTLQSTALGFDHHDYRGLADFKASDGFPQGLKGLTSRVKDENPLINEIGVWHALMGYWGGISSEGWIVDNYETVDIDGKVYYAVPTKLKTVSSANLNRFYDDFYAYLAASGISFVKTDVQCLLSEIQNSPDRVALIPAYQTAWTMAYLRRLGGKAISCMSHIPELLWQSLLQTKTAPVIFRNSDDFFPEIPSSHAWHIWTNAHNTLFTQHLNAVLDWDMFQSCQEYGPAHAASRCLSGGPIFFTDVPGEHDLELLAQVSAPSPDGGRSVILRPHMFARTSRAFDRYQESGVLKIITESVTGAKFMGLFNTRNTSVATLVATSEFLAIGESHEKTSTEVVFLSHQTQAVRGPVRLQDASTPLSGGNALIEVGLAVAGYEILSSHQVHRLSSSVGEHAVAVLGLLGKMTGAAAICSMDISPREGEISIEMSLKALGRLGIWVSDMGAGNLNIRGKLEGIDVGQDSIVVSDGSHAGVKANILSVDLLREWAPRQSDSSLQQVSVEIIITV
ncbi:hypothetical protein NM208_g8166 [Fusarium decemcellulare]|uniref:Uncharacterized protein n=1 Tax=Fusarium decemcellulare TaxID=57161 RepID=A0ACC1S6G1_9HYPO|nr:hypothetical protein NM208_g8166 [Fusarium decemcellulare]